MLVIAIDAAVLIFVLQAISNDELDFITAAIVAFVAAVGTNLLAFGLASAMGTMGAILTLVLAPVLLGAAMSLLFGIEIKRAVLAGVIFLATHIGVSLMFGALL